MQKRKNTDKNVISTTLRGQVEGYGFMFVNHRSLYTAESQNEADIIKFKAA